MLIAALVPCITGTVFQAMQPVLLYHSSATAGVLAWRGIIAAATVFAETDARATCSSLGNPASHTAGKGSAKGPSEPLPQGPSPAPDSLTTMTPSFLTALPSVMACYSCHAEPASQPPPPGTTEQGPGMAHGLQQQLKPVFRLLKADPCLMRPYIAALVNQGQYSVGQLPPASPAQPISPCLAQPCDGADKGGVSGPLEHARQADGGDDPLGAWGGAGGRGEAVVAAVQALLALCEEQALLAQVLRLLQPLLETCSTLRYAVVCQRKQYFSSGVGSEGMGIAMWLCTVWTCGLCVGPTARAQSP